jgi:hypothetical protein
MEMLLYIVAALVLTAAAALGWHVARSAFRRCFHCGGDGVNTGCPRCAR